MSEMVERAGLQVHSDLATFVEKEALPGTDIEASYFWKSFAALIEDFGPENSVLLERREDLQQQIDEWYRANPELSADPEATGRFLEEIGYILPQGGAFSISTQNVDPEIATVPGPQLVVPITNARYALNAANARWGSLYDALYGTDALGDLPQSNGFDSERGARVVAYAKTHMDKAVPLAHGSWAGVTGINVLEGRLQLTVADGTTGPADTAQFIGYRRDSTCPLKLLFRSNGLLIELQIDPSTTVGRTDPAGISDIRLESALTAIMDCEDSVACVDGPDKTLAYRNWLGLMKGDLTAEVSKGGRSFTRELNPDADYLTPDGGELTVKGRALLWVRNVGHLMRTPAVLDRKGDEVFEGLLDAMMTTLVGLHDLGHSGGNSAHGSIYVVKPKMHGPEEVQFTDRIFERVEQTLGLPANTVKLGIMDEERRTSLNLMECIRAAKARVAFINTGFLDRTGDEIHTAMEAGPMIRKAEIKSTPWIASYEDRNVDIGLSCGLKGRAQIGKGMWAMPDRMKDMIDQKIGHPQSGANCAWVPSPTAATLHAMHYHLVDVIERQNEILANGPRGTLKDLLTIPLSPGTNWSKQDIDAEIENNAQGILGYVVRWIDDGVGCSKVPDIHDVGLMEDRATCRISSQHLANWLHHGVVDEPQVMAALQKMAAVVDRQNADDPGYQPMAPDFSGVAFQAACDLVFKGRVQPSGYTEPVLHARRLEKKASL